MNDIPLKYRKSSFVNGLAFVTIIVALFLIVSDVISTISTINLVNSPGYQMVMSQIQKYQPDTDSLLFSTRGMIAASIISIALYAAMIPASIALLKRKNWGRISYIVLVGLQTAFYLWSSIAEYYAAGSIARAAGLDQLAGTSGLLSLGGYAVLGGIVIVISIAIGVVWKLSTASIRSEFS